MDQEKQYVFGKDMYNYQSFPLVIRIMTIVYPQMIKINSFLTCLMSIYFRLK